MTLCRFVLNFTLHCQYRKTFKDVRIYKTEYIHVPFNYTTVCGITHSWFMVAIITLVENYIKCLPHNI